MICEFLLDFSLIPFPPPLFFSGGGAVLWKKYDHIKDCPLKRIVLQMPSYSKYDEKSFNKKVGPNCHAQPVCCVVQYTHFCVEFMSF